MTTIFKDEDYDTLKGWWEEFGYGPPHLSQLQTLGVIGYDGDTPACAVFAYKSDGVNVAFLEHLITNPAVKSPMRKIKAMSGMMEFILDELEADGYQIIRGTTWSTTLARACKKRWGFQILDVDSVNMSLFLP